MSTIRKENNVFALCCSSAPKLYWQRQVERFPTLFNKAQVGDHLPIHHQFRILKAIDDEALTALLLFSEI